MWTGGKPPRIPQQALKKPDTTQSGVAFRSNIVDSELEALKQRGLAKILNKHFTETTKKLAEEKAAADAALADLERRKANTSEFQVSKNGELSPLDSMYVSANAWRNECRRKERETLLLYQRYVDKFGATGQVRLPETTISRPTKKNKEARSWMVKDDGSVASIPAAPPATPPAQLVPTMAAEIERTLDEYIQKGALSVPSVEVLGIEKTFQTARSQEEIEFRNFYRKQLEQRTVDAKSPERVLDKKDTFFGPGWVESLGPGSTGVVTPSKLQTIDGKILLKAVPGPGSTSRSNLKEDNDELHEVDEDDDEDLDELYDTNLPMNATTFTDDCSVVSGLTSIHSHITRSVIQDCERSVFEFLKEEKSYIQKIIREEERVSAEVRAGNIRASKATQEAENMVKQMQDILTEYQAKHIDESNNGYHEARRFHTDNPDEMWMVYYDEFYQQEYYHECNSNRTQWEPPAQCNTVSSPGKDASSTSISGTGSEHTVDASAVPDGASVSSNHAVFLSSEDVMPERSSASIGYPRRLAYESRIAEYRRKRRRERKRRMLAMFFASISIVVGSITYCVYYQPALMQSVSTSIDKYIDEVLTSNNIDRAPLDSGIEKIQVAASNIMASSNAAASSLIASSNTFTSKYLGWQFEADVVSKAMNVDQIEPIESCPQLQNEEPSDLLVYGAISTPSMDYSPVSKKTTKTDQKTDTNQILNTHPLDDDNVSLADVNEKEVSKEVEYKPASNAVPMDETSNMVQVFSDLVVTFDTKTERGGASSPQSELKQKNGDREVEAQLQQRNLIIRPWACNIPFAYLVHPRCFRLANQLPAFDLQDLVRSMLQ